MFSIPGERALYVKEKEEQIIYLLELYVNDWLNAGSAKFEELVMLTLQMFESKRHIYDSLDLFRTEDETL